jgi:hypothetical protein
MAIADDATKTPVPPATTTPSRVAAGIGALQFTDGYPTQETAANLRDHLDYLHGVEAFMNSVQGVSAYAVRQGFHDAGVMDNDVLIFSELMDAKSLFLTGNADTVYFWASLDMSEGPLVFEAPSESLGVIDDMWFRWVTDFGLPGPDRGQGGRYLLVGPGYDGPLAEGGYYVRHSRTNHAVVIGRAFINENPGMDPAPTVARIKEQLKIYRYVPGGEGSSIGAYLAGEGPLAKPVSPESPRFVEGSGLAMNTVAPNDFGHYEMLDALVQLEPAEALDAELAGQFAPLGIVKDQTFAPDARLRAILDDAAAVGNAAARTLGMGAHPTEGFRYYDGDTAWWNPLFAGGYEFTNPPPKITEHGVEQSTNTGDRKLHARTSMLYLATGITPAMCMRLTGVGAQYVVANLDAAGDRLDGSKAYRLTLPKDIPAARFWSLTVYDNQNRSMLQTPQRYPRAGSQSYPTPAAEAEPDGSTVLYVSPTRPDDVAPGNWIQTDPDKGWCTLLRLYSPLPAFFDKTWRPSEFELMR